MATYTADATVPPAGPSAGEKPFGILNPPLALAVGVAVLTAAEYFGYQLIRGQVTGVRIGWKIVAGVPGFSAPFTVGGHGESGLEQETRNVEDRAALIDAMFRAWSQSTRGPGGFLGQLVRRAGVATQTLTVLFGPAGMTVMVPMWKRDP